MRQGFPLAVVVEALRPPELFGWFKDLRASQGFKVIAHSDHAPFAAEDLPFFL